MQIHRHPDPLENAVLHVIIVVSNPAEFERRYQLFEEFIDRYDPLPNIEVHSIELQYGMKPFRTSAKLKYRTDHELWSKENLINLGVQHSLPQTWEYMAWIDADIEFHNEKWAEETLLALQHYTIVQLFSHAVDLGPKDEAFATYTSFGYDYFHNGIPKDCKLNYQNRYHTGYGYAITREGYNAMGGLPDFGILGSGDAHIAYALVNMVEFSYHPDIHPNYKLLLKNFQERCNEYIKQNIGYVAGTIMHHFHGPKKYRRYRERWKVLVDNKFDPLVDIWKDCNGLYQLTRAKPALRNDIRVYFRQRNEDSKTLE